MRHCIVDNMHVDIQKHHLDQPHLHVVLFLKMKNMAPIVLFSHTAGRSTTENALQSVDRPHYLMYRVCRQSLQSPKNLKHHLSLAMISLILTLSHSVTHPKWSSPQSTKSSPKCVYVCYSHVYIVLFTGMSFQKRCQNNTRVTWLSNDE